MTRIPFGAKFVDKNSTRLLIFLLLLMKLEPLAQLVEHRPFKAGVPGSTPGRLTIFRGLRCPLHTSAANRRVQAGRAGWSLSLSLALLAGSDPQPWERGNGF